MNARHDMTRNHMKWHETKGNAIDKGMKVWMNQWRNAWVNEWIAPAPTFFLDFYVKSSSRYILVHFLSTTLPDRAAQPRKQRPSFGDHGSHFTRKNAGFCARDCFQAWIHAFRSLTLPNYLHDLAWWCGCHDGWGNDVVVIMVRNLVMTLVRNSEVS